MYVSGVGLNSGTLTPIDACKGWKFVQYVEHDDVVHHYAEQELTSVGDTYYCVTWSEYRQLGSARAGSQVSGSPRTSNTARP